MNATRKPFVVRRPFALAPGWFSYRQQDGSWGADFSNPKRFATEAEALTVCTPQNEGKSVVFTECLEQERRRLLAAIDSLDSEGSVTLSASVERNGYREKLARVLDALLAERAHRIIRSDAERARNEGVGQPADDQGAQEVQS